MNWSKRDSKESKKSNLSRATALAGVVAVAAVSAAAPAHAQTAPAPAAPATSGNSDETIVVTGSMIRGANKVSPVTVVQAESLDTRGISTIQDAVQMLSANNGPALPNSFSANGAFAGGASGVSLRGLSTNSTLVLFDGLRASYYPLADDGSRNFVDLNTIPDDIVERIEVLRDGASATYGADAIAGVVNVITKREFQGLSVRGEGGISSRNDAGSRRFSITAGVGDLATDHINAYVSVFGYSSDLLYNKDRPYPYNSDDYSNVCFQGTCGSNNIVNGNGGLDLSPLVQGNYIVRPVTVGPGNAITPTGGAWQLENTNCAPGTAVTVAGPPTNICEYDVTKLYGVINPKVERFGLSARVTARVLGDAEAYLEANFLQSTVSYPGLPETVDRTANTGILFKRFSTAVINNPARDPGSFVLFLPNWVCSERVNCATQADRHLNPNNPFASATPGSERGAQIEGRDMNHVTFDQTQNRTYRVAGGLSGSFSNDWQYDIAMTAMHTDLAHLEEGYIWIQHLLDVINDGTYNFINPSANSQAVNDYLYPSTTLHDTSDQLQLQGTVTLPLFELPGGTAHLAVGASARYEAVDSPSGNPDFNGPTQRYFTLNAFGTNGSRDVYSGFFEVNAPVLEQVEVNLSGRYDRYSTGQTHFSPKVGVVYRPLDILTVRGTYSEGFRIPSFGEANALPTTGFVSNTAGIFNDTYLAQYGCSKATFASCPAYINLGSFGQTSLASPNLNPEESKSYTLGFVVDPIHGLEFTFDWYRIEKTGAITAPSNAPALAAYYSGAPIPAGYTVIADAPDPLHPLALPRVSFVQAQLVNANTVKTEGFDIGATYSTDIMHGIHWNSSLDVSYIKLLETTFPGGATERYDGTLGNFNLTAGTGTPKWHGSWVNTLSLGMWDVSATMNYFGGYNLSAMDQGTGYKDCGLDDGSLPCNVDNYVTWDLNAQAHLNDKLTLYATVLNVSDELPPIDTVTYGAHAYNPLQGGNGILGRYFRAGFKLNF